MNRFEKCFKPEKLSSPALSEAQREAEMDAVKEVLSSMEIKDDKKGILLKGGGRFISSSTEGVQGDIEAGPSPTKNRGKKRDTKSSNKSKNSSKSSDKHSSSSSSSSDSDSDKDSSKKSSRSDGDNFEKHELSFDRDKFVDTNNYKADFNCFMLNCLIYKLS